MIIVCCAAHSMQLHNALEINLINQQNYGKVSDITTERDNVMDIINPIGTAFCAPLTQQNYNSADVMFVNIFYMIFE